MFSAALSLVLAVQAASGVPVERTAAQNSAAAAVAAFTDGCLAEASGVLTLGPDQAPDRHAAFFTAAQMREGTPADVLAALGTSGFGIVENASAGHRLIGDDRVVMAIGGDLPTCRVVIASPARELDDGVEISEAVLASGRWRLAQVLPNNGAIKQRMFAHRAADGRIYLLFAATGTLPGSTVRTLLAISPVPPGFQPPAGL
jgi:hypothetical protein